MLWGGEIAAALFLSIDRDGVEPVAMPSEPNAIAAATRARLARLYDSIAVGAQVPAQGSDDVCQYCEFQGLCRKAYWIE